MTPSLFSSAGWQAPPGGLYVHTPLSDYVLPVLRVLCMHTGKCTDNTSEEAADSGTQWRLDHEQHLR